jgi:hypothetical protein
MRNLQNILKKRTLLTQKIETEYSELYVFLNESPITIPSKNKPNIDIKIMQSDAETLEQMLKNHIKTPKNY